MNSSVPTQETKLNPTSTLNKFSTGLRFNEHLNLFTADEQTNYIPSKVTKQQQRLTQLIPVPATTSVNSKLSLDGKLVDFDVLTKLQQQSGGNNIVSFAASKEFLSNLTGASKISNNNRQSVISTAGNANKQNQFDSNSVFKPIRYSYPGNTIRKNEKTILPKLQTEYCEVKKFAPEMNGLLTDLSTALKSNMYSNQANVSTSTTTFKISKSSSVYQSAKTTAQNFNQAKNSLLGRKSANQNLTSKSSTNQNKNTIKTSHQTVAKKKSPNYTSTKVSKNVKSSSSSSIEYLNNIANSYQQRCKVSTNNTSNFYNLSEFTADTHYRKENHENMTSRYPYPILEYTNSSAIKSKQSKHQAIKQQSSLSCQKVTDSIKKFEINNSESNGSKSNYNIDETTFRMQNILQNMEQNKLKHNRMANQIKGAIPELNKNTDETIKTNERSNLVDVTGENPKQESIEGFSELYETAVKNLLNIKVFPDDNKANEKKISPPLPRYHFENELEIFMKKPIEKETSSSSDYVKNSYEPWLKKYKLDKQGKTYENSVTTTKPDKQVEVKTEERRPYSYSFTELLESNDVKFSELQENNKLTNEFENQNFFTKLLMDHHEYKPRPPYFHHGELPWLYAPYLYKPLTPLPHQPPYLSNPYFYYGEQPPKFPNVTTANIDVQEEKSVENFEIETDITKTETSNKLIKSPTNESHVDKNINDILLNEEVKNITKLKKLKKPTDKLSSKRNTPTPSENKKSKKDTLKYRPYRLRDRIKASKKAKKLMEELEKEPKPPKYILKDINKHSTKKELYLNEFGLRKIIKRIDPSKDREAKKRHIEK